jgi:amino-acid N-acetyltransferase
MRAMKKHMKLTPFGESDREGILRLLEEANLPTHDLTTEKLKNFLVARDEGTLIGTIGIESYNEVGLLRSLVVHPLHRGKGWGKELTEGIEDYSKRAGVKTLFLLTMTAADFFPRLGYHVTKRSNVPMSIAESYEFKSACPVSAVCLSKNLG